MEGMLIKLKEGSFYLQELPKKGIGGAQCEMTIGSTWGEGEYKLSLKNCEVIASGYNLEELAYEKSWNEDSEKGFINGAKAILEILGDKKFTADDMKRLLSLIVNNAINVNNTDKAYNYIESLQPSEWDVEVVTEDEFISNQGLDYNESVRCRVLIIDGDDVYGEYIDGTLTNLDIPFSLSGLNDMEGNSVGKPKLDEDGCIILKRI
jgi:hypothetical protein